MYMESLDNNITMQKIQNWTQKYIGIWESRPLTQVKYIGICHTAFPADPKQDSGQQQTLEQVCDQVDSWHKNRFGADKCISYHYMIAKNGDIAQCNTLESNSYTVGNNRPYTICICLDGNFEFQQPTTAQLQSLEDLTKELGTQHPEFPASMADIYGDNELNYKGFGASDGSNSTACPGKNLMPYVIKLRTTGQISSLRIPTKMETQPNQIADPRLIKALANPYYMNLYQDRNVELALADISDRDDEIKKLKNKVSELDQIIGQPKSVDTVLPILSPKVEFVNNVNETIKPPNLGNIRDKIKSGHILEVLLSTLFGLITFLNTSGFNPSNFTDKHSMIAGLLTLIASYFGFRSDLINNRPQQ